jgi:hypothetical protein
MDFESQVARCVMRKRRALCAVAGFRSSILLWQNRFANCEVDHTQELNFILASGDRAEAPMQTKPRTHNTARDMERSREKLVIWAGRAMTVLLLICASYFIVDIVRIVWTAPGF